MEEYLIVGPEAQSLSGAVMEAPGGMSPFLPSDCAQAPVLREVLADPSMGIFIRVPFPGAVGMGPVDCSTRDWVIRSCFAASVP